MMNLSERQKMLEMADALNTRDKQIDELNSLLDVYEKRYNIISKGKTVERKPTLREMLLERIANSDSFRSFCEKLVDSKDVADVKCRFSFSRAEPYKTLMHDEDGVGRKKILKIPYEEETLSQLRDKEKKHGEFVTGKNVDGKKYFTFEEA